jgi:sugar transferase (PEP-CTERM system associated)
MPRFGITRRVLILATIDTLTVLAAIGVARRSPGGWISALLAAAVVQTCLHYVDWYERPLPLRARIGAVLSALAASAGVLVATRFAMPRLAIAPGTLGLAAAAAVPAMLASHVCFDWLTARGALRRRLLLVGTEPAAIALARELFERRHELGIDIVGFIDPDPARLGMPLINPGVIGTIDDIPSIVRARRVDRVVISRGDGRGTLPMDALLGNRLDGIRFDHLATTYETLTGKIAVTDLRPSWIVFSDGFRQGLLQRGAKRALDVLGALIGLLVAAPLLLLVALAVRLTSPGPIVYSQQRVGRHGQLFTVRKFRSMRQDAEAGTGAVWAQKNDPRITTLGRLMRKTRLDELPQLWNVLSGDMSLVGPRPERPEFVSQLTQQIPFYGQRHAVRPGLTGWAQVRYTYGSSVEDAMEKLQYDLFYIKHLSIALDLFIVVSTIKTVLMRKGAV